MANGWLQPCHHASHVQLTEATSLPQYMIFAKATLTFFDLISTDQI